MSNVQILVAKIQTVLTSDMGRYAVLTPLSDIVREDSYGVSAEFVDRKGHTCRGIVVDMHSAAADGLFPDTKGIIVDTCPEKDAPAVHKRMSVGGAQAHAPTYKRPSGSSKGLL